MSTSPASTARKLALLIAKHHPAPAAASTTPASAGPKMRAVLNMLELSAIAFGSSSRPTSCIVRFWRAGRSKTTARPVSIAIAYTCHVCTFPIRVTAASSAEKTSCADCVTITVRRLSNRSATTPAKRPKSVNGPKRASDSTPTAIGECVSERISQ